jgi:hypothetical protein
MAEGIDRVVVGNVIVHPAFRDFLSKSCYHMNYDPKGEVIVLFGDHGSGGQVLLEIQGASLENAIKLGEHLGLRQDSSCYWSKWNPKVIIGHDGSRAADQLLLVSVKLGVPHRVRESPHLELMLGDCCYTLAAGWTFERMLSLVQDVAARHKEQLGTTP